MTGWTVADIPPLGGKTVVITGATGGLGYETGLALAGAGAAVVLTGRNDVKGQDAIQRIRGQFPDATISYEALDLTKLASVADFASRFAATHASPRDAGAGASRSHPANRSGVGETAKASRKGPGAARAGDA